MNGRVVLKYDLDGKRVGIRTGANPKVVLVGEQHGRPKVWIEQDSVAGGATTIVDLALMMTGEVSSPDRRHVGSAICAGGDLVVHVYEAPR